MTYTIEDWLERIRNKGWRIRLWYGDPADGVVWAEENDMCGYVGRSTGREPCYILIHNKRSSGGGAILTDNIVRIDRTSDGRILYKHPTFDVGVWGQRYASVYHNGTIYAQCSNEERARRLIQFMQGARYTK